MNKLKLVFYNTYTLLIAFLGPFYEKVVLEWKLMKKLKPIFYSIYILFFLFIVFLGVFHEKMVLEWKWDWINTWVGLMMFILKVGGVGMVLFIANLVIERLHIKQLKKEIKDQKDKITSLENKLGKS